MDILATAVGVLATEETKAKTLWGRLTKTEKIVVVVVVLGLLVLVFGR